MRPILPVSLRTFILVGWLSWSNLNFVKSTQAETPPQRLLEESHTSAMCVNLAELLTLPTLSRARLRDHFASPHQTRWRYRRARKLLFARIAPQLSDKRMVIEALYTGRRASPRSMKSPRGFNCEHLWPRAWMSAKSSKAYRHQEADLHNLYPSEVRVNSRRGHLAFGEVVTSRYSAAFPSQIGDNEHGVEVIEVRDEYKGDVARTLLYMAARWGLMFPATQRLDLLARWAAHDPPSRIERQRNQKISALQKNRNLLIDCPQLTGALIERLQSDLRRAPKKIKSRVRRSRQGRRYRRSSDEG